MGSCLCGMTTTPTCSGWTPPTQWAPLIQAHTAVLAVLTLGCLQMLRKSRPKPTSSSQISSSAPSDPPPVAAWSQFETNCINFCAINVFFLYVHRALAVAAEHLCDDLRKCSSAFLVLFHFDFCHRPVDCQFDRKQKININTTTRQIGDCLGEWV